MATLTIRDMDDGVVERLKARAKANNRSLEGEVRRLLTEAAQGRPDRSRFLELAEEIRRMTPAVAQSETVALLREDRDR